MGDLKADDLYLDAAGTRKLADQKLSRKDEEEAIRRSDAWENDWRDTLRKVSRQEYLKKREQKKLDELRDDNEDEQYLFEGVKLTGAEYSAQRMAFCFSCCCLLKKIKKFLTRRLLCKQLNKEAENDIQTSPLVSE